MLEVLCTTGTPAAPTAGHPKHSFHLLQLPAQSVPAVGRALLALHGGAAARYGGGRPQRGNLPGVHQALDVVICVLEQLLLWQLSPKSLLALCLIESY